MHVEEEEDGGVGPLRGQAHFLTQYFLQGLLGHLGCEASRSGTKAGEE